MTAKPNTHPTHSLLIENIGSLVVVPPGPLVGSAMRNVPTIDDAALWIDQGTIRWFGPSADAPQPDDCPHISAEGGTLVPGLIDPHTHIPFCGERSGEFVRRIAGESYLSIMESGGGIRVTTKAVRAATLEQLVDENLPRLARMLAGGVTTVECKSGYGLAPRHELKQLHAIHELAARQPIDLVPTYLGAHAIPEEFEGRADAFIDEIASDKIFGEIKKKDLAVFCDVFCDRGALTVDQARRVLTRAAKYGLTPKLHADELAQIGASRLAGEVKAISADHLELIDEEGMAAMRAAGTVAVVLPGTSFFLGIEHANARKMIEAGLAVALATDCNPGSSHIDSLPMIMDIACCQLRMTPEQVIAAVTANAAAACNIQDRTGAIREGFAGD
ncbi:MAG: imidazolonepropionase, partial [Planctomycetes bacterium]|nr:imidazolonepropionase [Planctomycetota bacterium]